MDDAQIRAVLAQLIRQSLKQQEHLLKLQVSVLALQPYVAVHQGIPLEKASEFFQEAERIVLRSYPPTAEVQQQLRAILDLLESGKNPNTQDS
jgi:hypothetical protein